MFEQWDAELQPAAMHGGVKGSEFRMNFWAT